MMNINNFYKMINVENELKDVKAGEGTFNEFKDLIYAGKVVPICQNNGNIIGISVDAGCNDIIRDNIEGMKFELKYAGKPMMRWYEIIMQAKLEGRTKEAVSEPKIVNEDDYYYNDEQYGDDESDIYDYDNRDEFDFVDGLPTRVLIGRETLADYNDVDFNEIDIDDKEKLKKQVKKYLREYYKHYLSGLQDNMEIIFRPHADDKYDLVVKNISWGRKI